MLIRLQALFTAALATVLVAAAPESNYNSIGYFIIGIIAAILIIIIGFIISRRKKKK